MESTRELRELLEAQRAQTARLEAAVTALERADDLREREALRGEVERLRVENAGLREQAEDLRRRADIQAGENRSLRERLAEQVARQKAGVVAVSRAETELLIGREEGAAVDRLAAHSGAVRGRLGALRAELAARQEPEAAELMAEVARLEERSRLFMGRASAALDAGFAAARAGSDAGYDAIATQPVSPGAMEEKLRRDNLELRIGGRVTVIVGVCFMLLAVALGLRYTFLYLLHSDLLKGILAHLLGLLFLGGGELMHRKQRSHFSTAICAGGIAILFTSTAVSYFGLGILSIPVAVALCAAITALALVQALRYDAQLVAVFALIGGYLPMTAVDRSPVMIVSAMAYFLLLNLFVLLVALRRRWQPLKFFSLIAGFAGVVWLLWLQDFAPAGTGVLYVLANFLLYLAIVLVYPALRGGLLQKSDTVLLAINTAAGCGLVFALLGRNGYESLGSVVALAVCLLYFGMAKWLGKALRQDAGARGLFYATSFAFWVLAVPLQFESRLVSLGWLCEGVALYGFGELTGRPWYRRAGGVITALCCLSFAPKLAHGLSVGWGYPSGYLLWNYGAITLGLLVMLGITLYRHPAGSPLWSGREGALAAFLRVAALANLWGFALYCVETAPPYHLIDWRWEIYWSALLAAAVTLGLGVCGRAIPPLRSRGVTLLARVQYITGLLLCFWAGAHAVPGRGAVWLLGLVLLLLLWAGAVLALSDLLRGFGKVRPEWVWLGTALYALAALTQVLAVQADQGIRSMAVSFVFIAWALGLILLGFVRLYPVMRRFGLGLSLLSISKLFLLDLSFLKSGQRILSYFVFGLVFIGIAYVYQRFARRLVPAGIGGAPPEFPPIPHATPGPGESPGPGGEPVEQPDELPEQENREEEL